MIVEFELRIKCKQSRAKIIIFFCKKAKGSNYFCILWGIYNFSFDNLLFDIVTQKQPQAIWK